MKGENKKNVEKLKIEREEKQRQRIRETEKGREIEIKGKQNDPGAKHDNLLNIQNQSRRSTNFTNFSFNLTGKKENPADERTEGSAIKKDKQKSDELICGVCAELAEGYCPACPYKRFCTECFADDHRDKPGIHRFVSYEKKRKMKNLTSMKILFKQ